MVNFANAVSRVSYGKLRTVTPNAKDVKEFLQAVALTNPKTYGKSLSNIAEKEAIRSMYSMNSTYSAGAKKTGISFKEGIQQIIKILKSFQSSQKVGNEPILGDLRKYL